MFPFSIPTKRLRTVACGLCVGFLTACGPEIQEEVPGRGAAVEQGPIAKVYPSGEEARMDRHGLWRGLNDGQVIWEVHYTRGYPTGPYRQWNAEGEMIATWPYNWDGEIEGWARWFENGEPLFKLEITPESQPDFDPIGRANAFREWAEEEVKSGRVEE